jgi:hypothetical protein
MRGTARVDAGFGGHIMKRVVVAIFSAAFMVLGAGLAPAQAARHSGPEALAKGDGAVTSTSTDTPTPVYRELCTVVTNFCSGPYPVATETKTTKTEESFDFTAKLGPKASSLDPTSGAYGSMKLAYKSTVTTTVAADPTYYQFCDPASGFYAPQGCPALGPSGTTTKQATATADVTCLNVVDNRAAIGGHVVKFSGDFTPTRGMLFNATDNTVARQQPSPDEFMGTFVTDAPQTCPDPGADSPITSGDILVDQS